MENASKALLIAGAILLAIAIIAIGMSIFGATKDTISKAEGQIDNMSIQMHNQQFTSYEGENKTFDDIRELISTIYANNDGKKERDKLFVCITAFPTIADNGDVLNLSSGVIHVYGGAQPVNNGCYNSFSKLSANPKSRNLKYDVKFIYTPEGIIKELKVMAANN